MIPTEVKMEDLSGLEKQIPNLMLNLTFANADNNVSPKIALHRRLYVRLVDKAIDEYQASRMLLVAQVTEGQRTVEEIVAQGRLVYMFQFTDHIENCISTVRRVLRYLDFIKGNQDGFQVPRLLRKQIESLALSIVEIRNVVEHMDNIIQEGQLHDDLPVIIKLLDSQDGIKVGDRSLKFRSLSTVISRLQQISKEFTAWNAGSNEVSSA